MQASSPTKHRARHCRVLQDISAANRQCTPLSAPCGASTSPCRGGFIKCLPPGRLPCKGGCRCQATEGCGTRPCQYPPGSPRPCNAGLRGKICRWFPGRCEHRPLRKADAACIAYRSRQGVPNGLQGRQAAGPGAAGRWCCGGQPAAIALASSSPMKMFSSAAVNPRSTQLCTVTARLNLPGRQKFSTSLGMVRSKTTALGNSTP